MLASDATSARRCRTDGERSAPCTTIGGARVMWDRLCGEAAPQWPGTRRRRRARDSGVSSTAADLPGRKRREGRRIAIEEERESRPDVKAAGCRGEDEECVVQPSGRDTAPPSDEDELEGQKQYNVTLTHFFFIAHFI